MPASNQKLFSSAYVLSKYKLNNNLKTSLFIKNKNDYYLFGQGDPDLNYEDIIELISNIKENKTINFNIVEIDSKLNSIVNLLFESNKLGIIPSSIFLRDSFKSLGSL